MTFERIEFNGVTYAEVIRANVRVSKSTFISRDDCSMQLGLLAHPAGYVEPVHYHKEVERVIRDLQQFFVVQSGKVAVTFHSDNGGLLHEVVLHPGDGILLINGAHSLRMIEDGQCISVKQGPFLGIDNDKVNLNS